MPGTTRTTHRAYPWRLVSTQLTASGNINLAAAATGGGYSKIAARSPIYLSRLWDSGTVPDYLMVAPVGEQVQNNQNLKFAIYTYRAAFNNLERLCAASAIVGTYLCSSLAPRARLAGDFAAGTAATYPASTFYLDQIIITKNYGRSITLLDAATDNGKGTLVFDTHGANILVPALISTIATNGKLSFELAGYDG